MTAPSAAYTTVMKGISKMFRLTAGIQARPVAGWTQVIAGLQVTFTSTATDNGSIASTAWNFGDGNTAATASPVHTYAAAGTYTVTMTVTDNNGATDTKRATVTVA